MPPLAASCECAFGLWGSPGSRPRPDVSSCPTRSSSAGDAVERAWVGTMQRVAAMPTGTVDASVDGEWSFAQTLRHLVMATDTWLGKAVLRVVDPYHPIGQPYDNAGDSTAIDEDTFSTEKPSFDEVLRVRAERQAMVRDFLAATTAQELVEPRRNPHAPDHEKSVLSCLHTVLEEEWEHHRYAVRDLEALTL